MALWKDPSVKDPSAPADAGSVASTGVGARCEPRMPPSSTIMNVPDEHSACVAASSQALRMRHSSPGKRACYTRARRAGRNETPPTVRARLEADTGHIESPATGRTA